MSGLRSTWWFALLLAGCKERTELMIGVATDLRAPDSLDSAQLVVSRTSDGVVQQQLSWDISGVPTQPFNLPGSFGVFTDGDEPQISIELGGFKNGQQLVSRRAVLSLIEGETLFVRLTVVGACMNRTDCGASQSCVEGQCVDQLIDARRLPSFTANLVTEVTCLGGTTFIDTSTGDRMQMSADAAMCPGDRCFEGTCFEPPPGVDPGMSDSGMDIPLLPPNLFVIASQTLPATSNQAKSLGLDLDGDGMVDNQMGMVVSTLASQGISSQASLDTAIAKGQALTVANLGAVDFANGQGTFVSFLGANPQPAPCNGGADMVCGHHLQGTGTFDIAAASPRNTPLVGNIVNGVLAAGPGNLVLHTSINGLLALDLIGARVKITSISATALSGVIAGGIPKAEIDNNLIPQWATTFTANMLADCPGAPPSCGCAAGSTGANLHGLFDNAPADCTISVTEVRDNSLIQSLLAPDLTIGGQQALSFGLGFTAVPATFQLP